MAEARAPQESEVTGVLSFLDKYLRPGTGWSIAAEYPHVFTSGNLANLRIIEDAGQVLAHAAIKYLILKTHVGLFKVAAIGSVLTDPAHRNQGLSRQILDSCLIAANEQCADFAILWTDQYDLYRKMGFELAGREISVVIDEVPALPPSSIRILKSNKVSAEAILRVYQSHPCGTIRNTEDIWRNLQIPNSNVYTAWGADNQLLAYAVEGKGADLKGYVHEWGGSAQHLLPLLAQIRKDFGQPITIIMPASAQNLVRQLVELKARPHTDGFLGMIRPVNYQGLFAKVIRRARQIGLNDFVIEKTVDGFIVGSKNDTVKLSTPQELTRLFFGPHPDGSLKPEYEELFPIELWVWGWDSV
jgi:N-acetylglutamate synthase-like GNAT family acetyltransferase